MVPSGQHSLQKETDSCGGESSARKRTWHWRLSRAPLAPKAPSCEASAQRCGNMMSCAWRIRRAQVLHLTWAIGPAVAIWRACPPSCSDQPAIWPPANPLPSLAPHSRPLSSQSAHPSPAPSAPPSRHRMSGKLLRDQLSLAGVEGKSPRSGAGTFHPGGPDTAAGTEPPAQCLILVYMLPKRAPALCSNRGPPSPLPGATGGFWYLTPFGVLQNQS